MKQQFSSRFLYFLFEMQFIYHQREKCNRSSLRTKAGNREYKILQFAYLAPKRRVERLSDVFEGLGEQQQSNAVWEFPPCILLGKFIRPNNWHTNNKLRSACRTNKRILQDPCKLRITIRYVAPPP